MQFDLSQWVPAWLTTGLLLALVYFLRDRIAKYIDARAKHRFDEQLERLKYQLARSSQEIEALRSSVLGLRQQRQVTIEKRRLQAIDQLWGAVKELRASKNAAEFMAIGRFKELAERSKGDDRIRKVFEMIGDHPAPIHHAHEAQPYVSPLAWALFDAYQSTITYLNAQITVIKTGVGPEAIKAPEEMIPLIEVALPDWKGRLEEVGTAAFPYAINEMEKRLLGELRRMIAGDENDAEQLARAAHIASLVESLSQTEREATARAELLASGVEPVR